MMGTADRPYREESKSLPADKTNAEERRVHRVSNAGSFDRLVEVNLQLTEEVRKLIRTSYGMFGFFTVLLCLMLLEIIWRR